jgi:hypothetical protein
MTKKAYFLLIILCMVISTGIGGPLEVPETTTGSSYSGLSTQDLDKLVGPVALYPDPLLAQILAASAYPLEIVEAARWVSANPANALGIENQDWDPSVKAVAHYPQVLEMMNDHLDWTRKLGEAFLNQRQDVMKAIQNLRYQAREEGNLRSNDKQKVVIENNYIEVVPAEPGVMYIPVYNPYYVYSGPVIISFGLGLPLGVWCDLGFGWGGYVVVYRHWGRWKYRDRYWDGHGSHWKNYRTWLYNPVRAERRHYRASGPRSVSKGEFNHVTQGHRSRGVGRVFPQKVRPSPKAFEGHEKFDHVRRFPDRGIYSMREFHNHSIRGGFHGGAFGGGYHARGFGRFGGSFHGGFGSGSHGGGFHGGTFGEGYHAGGLGRFGGGFHGGGFRR